MHPRFRSNETATALIWAGAFILSALFAACAKEAADGPRTSTGTGQAEAVMAVAELMPTANNKARGTVQFVAMPDGVRVIAEIDGLSPGEHGFHVHETGDCSAPDAASAGGHFNPTNHMHAGRDASERHAGDLGNITADAQGRARLEFVDTHLALTGPSSIVGKAVIVHAGRDDSTSQPSGNSGPRVACGVVRQQ